MEMPKRKDLRLSNYDYSSNGAYYVTICTHNQVHLFGKVNPETGTILYNEAGKMVLQWLHSIPNKYSSVSLDCCVVLPNHIHFILFLDGSEHALGDIIKWFKAQSTNEYIRGVKQNRFPPFDKAIWQRNYYEHIVHSENELNQIRQYITYNSLKWNIVRE